MGNREIGRRIEQQRKRLGLTLDDIALTIGVARSTVQRYEKGSIDKIKLPVIEAIARVLDVSPAWLCCKSDDMRPEQINRSSLGNKQIMAANIRQHMASAGVTSKEVCSFLHIPMPTFSDWINAKTYPRIDKIEMLANYFGITKAELVESSENRLPKNAIPYNEPHMAPIVGSIPAGYPALAFEAVEGYASIPYADTENYFFLRVAGESMINAGIKSGDIVLIRKQDCADDGQIVAARVNGDEATLKRFKRQGDVVLLLPENPDYEPRVIPTSDFETGDAQIIGVAVEVRHTL